MPRLLDRLTKLLRASRPDTRIHIVVGITLIALAAFVAAVIYGFRESAVLVDDLDRQSEQHIAQNYIGRSSQRSIDQLKAQMTWDDAYRKIGEGSPDLKWSDNYVGDYFNANFGYEHLFLVGPDARLLRAWEKGKPVGDVDYAQLGKAISDSLRGMAGNGHTFGKPAKYMHLADTAWPVDDSGRPISRWYSTLVQFRGEPAILSILSVIPDTTPSLMTRTPNHLVAVRQFDASMLAEMSQALELKDIRFSHGPSARHQFNSLRLVDNAGKELGWLNWHANSRLSMIRSHVAPVFLSFVGLLIVMVLAGGTVVRSLFTALEMLEAREAQSHHASLHDAMTGLPNRSNAYLRLQKLLEETSFDDPDRIVMVGYLDIDHFKVINDTLGHHVGDELLRLVTNRLRSNHREGDFLARLGGDEFALVRTGYRSAKAVSAWGSETMALFREPFDVLGTSVGVTVSFGISWAPYHGHEAAELLCNADIALYRAKQRGRGRWRAFTRDMQESLTFRHELEVELRSALANGQLAMAYQPIVRAEDGELAGFEALVRWPHPSRGALGPDIFVPVAEQCGLMGELGEFVLRRVFTEMQAWPGQEFSVNLSPIQIMSRGFLERLAQIVDELGVDPHRVVFEVTEGIVLDHSEHVQNVFDRIRRMGFRIALDDFGIGYSSLSYLRSFEFDRIKVDRTFVQNIENDLDAQSILKAIVSLGKSLRMKVVAEGVETLLQRQLVQAAGCQLVQGYLFYKALSAEEVTALLAGPQLEETRRLRA